MSVVENTTDTFIHPRENAVAIDYSTIATSYALRADILDMIGTNKQQQQQQQQQQHHQHHQQQIYNSAAVSVFTTVEQQQQQRSTNNSTTTNSTTTTTIAKSSTTSIQETLFVNTSYGQLHIKVPYICSPQQTNEYTYGLPNNIIFLDDGGGWYSRYNTTSALELSYMFGELGMHNPLRDGNDPFVYRIYMNNPSSFIGSSSSSSSNNLRIWEVYTTKPYLVSVEMEYNFDTTLLSSPWILEYGGGMVDVDDNTKKKKKKKKKEDVNKYYPFQGRTYPPKMNNIYVSTIRLQPDNFTIAMSRNMVDLGFLCIRTNVGLFTISLDFIPSSSSSRHRHQQRQGSNDDKFSDEKLSDDDDTIHLVQDYIFNELLQSSESELKKYMPLVSVTRVHRFANEGYDDTNVEGNDDEFITATMKSNNNITSSPLLTAIPARIDFGRITTETQMKQFTIKVHNHHTYLPLRLMRISVAGNLFNSSDDSIEVGIDSFHGIPITTSPMEWILPPNTDSDLRVYCRYNPDSSGIMSAQFVTGNIVIRTSEDFYIPYSGWEKNFLLDLTTLGNDQLQYALEIPFEVSVLPGNIGVNTELMKFPSHFSQLAVDVQENIILKNNNKLPEYIDRYLDIRNNFAVPVTITGLRVLGSTNNYDDAEFCSNRFVILSMGTPNTAAGGMIWKGVLIRYRFLPDSHSEAFMIKKCVLSLKTDRAGEQTLPLIIYSGIIVVHTERANLDSRLSVNCCLTTLNDGSRVVAQSGMPCLHDWIKSSNNEFSGNMVNGIMKKRLLGLATQQIVKGSATHQSKDPVESYFNSLLPSIHARNSQPILQPIIFHFDAINSGETKTLSMYLTNWDRVPIDLSAAFSAKGNMNASIIMLPTSASQFTYKYDSPSPHVLNGAEVTILFHALLDTRENDVKFWTIPASGAARVDVTLKAPLLTKLTKNIAPFVGTGLLLQTNHGQVLPIITTCNIIVGSVRLTSFREVDDTNANSSVHRGNNTPLSSFDSFVHQRGVLISIENTLAQDLCLYEIRSCNRWFNLLTPEMYGISGPLDGNYVQLNYVPIKGVGNHSSSEKSVLSLGKVIPALSCSHPSGDTSFFACASAWLEFRDQIQPPGCGLSDEDITARWMSVPSTNASKRNEKRRKSTIINAIASFNDAVAFLSYRYANDGTTRSTSHESTRFHVFEHAWKMWKDIVSLGLNDITGHINATAVHTSDPNLLRRLGNESNYARHSASNALNHSLPPLVIPVASVLLQSKLELPTLFLGMRDEDSVGIVNFDTIHVADTATRFVRIVNPTAMSIHVRLNAIDTFDGIDVCSQKSVHVETEGDQQSWWTGGSYWMADDQGPLLSATHNVTVRAGPAGAFVSLFNPALSSMSAFVLGCGRRCALRNEQDANSEEKRFSVIGSGSGDGSILLGRVQTDTPRESRTLKCQPPPFSLTRFTHHVVMEPFSVAHLGPIHFRPPNRGQFEGTIYIENSLTGFEKLKVRGSGGRENLVILDRHPGQEGDLEFRFGKPTLVFPGTYDKRDTENGIGPVVRSVRLVNQGDIAVHINHVYMTSSEVMHFTHKKRHPMSSGSSPAQHCSMRGFALPGCLDSSHYWAETTSFLDKYFLAKPQARHNRRNDSLSFYNDGFTLQPNESQAIIVFHYPDCTFQTSYATVMFDIDTTHQSSVEQQYFRRRKVELLVGYDMSDLEYRYCVPYTSGMFSSEMPSIFKDVVSFGYAILTNSTKVPNLQRPGIILLAAMVTFLLVALCIDLVFTVDISVIRKSCPNWKPTIRCLARADPTSSDLVSIGKEQTKHVLLSRFKKEGALASHCVQSNGSFRRELVGSANGTHSDAIFDRLNILNGSKLGDDNGDNDLGQLPVGLGWSTAMRRGILKNDANTAEFLFPTRSRDLRLIQQQELKKKISNAPRIAPPAIPFNSTPTQQIRNTLPRNDPQDRRSPRELSETKSSHLISGASAGGVSVTASKRLVHANSESGEHKHQDLARIETQNIGKPSQSKQIQRDDHVVKR